MTDRRPEPETASDTLAVSAETAAKPEENDNADFVPFTLEFDQKKQKRKRILLVILLAAAALLGIFLLISSKFSSYERIMRHLQFDYRAGETVNEDIAVDEAFEGIAVSQQIAGKPITLNANVYVFNSAGDIALNAYRYDYTRGSGGNAALTVHTGTSSSLFTKKTDYQAGENGNGDPEASLLYDILFGTTDHDGITMQCWDAYYTSVGANSYFCELWLMSATVDGQEIYYTLYRYYRDDKLCGVRLLSSNSELMLVFDVTSYTAG